MYHEDLGKECLETMMAETSVVAPSGGHTHNPTRPEDTPPYEYTYDPLPPSPSMTPPASAESAIMIGDEQDEDEEVEVEVVVEDGDMVDKVDHDHHVVDDDHNDHEEYRRTTQVSPLTSANDADCVTDGEVCNGEPDDEVTLVSVDICDQRLRATRPERRSIRRSGRSAFHRHQPYYSSSSVLRPLNHQRSKVDASGGSGSGTGGGGVTSCHASPQSSEQVASYSLSSSTSSSTTSSSSSSSRSSVDSGVDTPLHVDTRLANRQSVESHQAKTRLARQILALIQADDFAKFQTLLSLKPDLNVFIDGQTALHYCLLLGRDVSWCKQLVSAGANPNLSNRDGWHPLHLAAFKGLRESLAYLTTCNHTTSHHHHHHHHSNRHRHHSNSNSHSGSNSNQSSPASTTPSSPTRG